MRHLTTIIIALLISALAFGKCGVSGIYILSNSSTLNKNGIIILEFQAYSQRIVPELNIKYPIYLKSANQKIILLPIEVLKGEFQLTQVILKPSSNLRENEVYELHIDKLPKDERTIERRNRHFNKSNQATFLVSTVVDNQSPVFDSFPQETRKIMSVPACGPIRWVRFKLSVQDKSETFVFATVKSVNTGITTNFILPIDSGEVAVGHGMCQGAFHFDNGINFEVSFALIDQSGNRSTATKPIAFQKPNNMEHQLRGKQNGS